MYQKLMNVCFVSSLLWGLDGLADASRDAHYARIRNQLFSNWLDVHATSLTRPSSQFALGHPNCRDLKFQSTPGSTAAGTQPVVSVIYPDGRVARAEAPPSVQDRVLFSGRIGLHLETNIQLADGKKALEILDFRFHHFFGGSDLGGFRHRILTQPGTPQEALQLDVQCGAGAQSDADLKTLSGLELGLKLIVSASDTPLTRPMTDRDSGCWNLEIRLDDPIHTEWPETFAELRLAGQSVPLRDEDEDLEADSEPANHVTLEKKEVVEVDGHNRIEKTRVTLYRGTDGGISRLDYSRSVSKTLGLFYQKVQTLSCGAQETSAK